MDFPGVRERQSEANHPPLNPSNLGEATPSHTQVLATLGGDAWPALLAPPICFLGPSNRGAPLPRVPTSLSPLSLDPVPHSSIPLLLMFLPPH